MDTLLTSGDHARDGRGLPIPIEGARELIQRALIRLSVRRGAFAGAPSLGSDLHRLRGAPEGVLARLALSYVQEALAPMREITVQRVDVAREGPDLLRVAAALSLGGKTELVEVDI